MNTLRCAAMQEYAHWLPEATLRPLIEQLILAAHQPERASGLELAHALELETVWLDSTCVKTNLHFPVDWVLLGDAVRTLMKATRLIRAHGLKHRMAPPEVFLKVMNRLSVQRTHARRSRDSQLQRKRTLRLMKAQVKVVAAHARRHRQLLDREWAATDWTRPQAEQTRRRRLRRCPGLSIRTLRLPPPPYRCASPAPLVWQRLAWCGR